MKHQRDAGLTVFICIMLAVCLVQYLVWTNKPLTMGQSTASPSSSFQSGSGLVAAPFIFEANVSAYCPCEKCCGEYADGITASGHVIQAGDKFVAAPKHIPFGTMLEIPGYGTVPVLDRGGAIKDNKIDTFHDSHEKALVWGRKKLWVKVLSQD